MNSLYLLRRLFGAALLTIAVAPSVYAEGTFDIPPGAHFNPQKLERVGDYLRDQAATGKIPGAILLIQQHGKPVYHEFFGVRDVATKLPMTDDTIFRLFSMSKPITSVVAMQLIEEGKFSLDDPIAKYLPLNISDTMTSVGHTVGQAPSFSPWAGFALLCAYAVGALAVGGVLMARRDA